jgi:hypothetical protein
MAARESRPLVSSLDEGVEKEPPHVRVDGGRMRVPHPSGGHIRAGLETFFWF